jgi:hypothetical protein
MGEPGDIVEFVKSDVQAPQRREITEKAQIPTRFSIDIELHIGPLHDEVCRLLHVSRRQRLRMVSHAIDAAPVFVNKVTENGRRNLGFAGAGRVAGVD